MLAAPASERPKNRTLPCLTKSLDRARNVFHRHRRIDAVLIKQVDIVCAEPAQRAMDRLPNVFGPTVPFGTNLSIALNTEAKLGANYHLLSPSLERPAKQFLVCEGTINFRRVEKGAPQFNSAMQCRDRLSLIRRTVRLTHAHAAEPDRRYHEAVTAKSTCT